MRLNRKWGAGSMVVWKRIPSIGSDRLQPPCLLLAANLPPPWQIFIPVERDTQINPPFYRSPWSWGPRLNTKEERSWIQALISLRFLTRETSCLPEAPHLEFLSTVNWPLELYAKINLPNPLFPKVLHWVGIFYHGNRKFNIPICGLLFDCEEEWSVDIS